MEPKKYEYIDSLRGIAILLVILVHVSNSIADTTLFFTKGMLSFVHNGQYGVQLFFLVSAFTLTISYHNRIKEKNAIRNFFIRRFFRIAPIYYLAIFYFTFFLFLGFNPSTMDTANLPLKGLISSVFFLNGIFRSTINSYVFGGWSITVEFMFYFTLPFICKRITNINRSLLFLIASLLIASLLNFLIVGSRFEDLMYLYYYFPNQLPIFALGIFLYWVVYEGIDKIKPLYGLLLASAVLVYCYIQMPIHFLHSIAFFFLLLVLIKKPYKLFSNKVLASIGKYSFSMYILHFVVIYLLNKYPPLHLISVTNLGSSILNFVIMYIIIFTITFILSHFTYKLIEVPGQNLGRKLIKKLDQRKINAAI